MESEVKQKAIIDFFTVLGQNCKYCILRNYENLPQYVGDDIDILIDGSDSLVDKLIIPIIKSIGWDYVVKFRKDGFTPIICMFTTDRSVDTLQLDIYTKFQWRGNRFCDEKAILESTYTFGQFSVASHGADLAITIAKELIGSGSVRQKYRTKIANFALEDKEDFYKVLLPIYFSNVDKLYNYCISKDFKHIDEMCDTLKKCVRNHNRAVFLSRSVRGCWDRIKNRFKPQGKMIAFVGPDGSGKTTLIRKEDKYMERFFPHNSKIFHRRYGVFPELHTGYGLSSMKGTIISGKSNLDPETNKIKKQRRTLLSKLAAWFVVLYYTLEYVVGNSIANKLLRNRTLILYDRYYYDHFVQPATRDLIWPCRYALLGVVKRPDLIIHLIASGEHIYKRKQDLDKNEINIQNQYMNRILKCCKNVVGLNMEQMDAEQVAAEVFRITINHFYGVEPRKNEV